jgi:ribosome-binding protein aMBF1 (putative translation factor)
MLCKVCGKNETERLVDVGLEEKVPVCTKCFIAGKQEKLRPAQPPEKPEAGESATEPDHSEPPTPAKSKAKK